METRKVPWLRPQECKGRDATDYRDPRTDRDFIGKTDLNRLLAAAARGSHRGAISLLIISMIWHGPRVSQCTALRRTDAGFAQAPDWAGRLKIGLSVKQLLASEKMRAARRWNPEHENVLSWLFVSERRRPPTRQAVHHMATRAGERAGSGRVHLCVLRHSCGFAPASRCCVLRLTSGFSRPPRSISYRTLFPNRDRMVRRA